jgi:hypothetical protein
MASIINATTTTGLVSSADNSGSLQLATNNGTTAVTIDTSQNVGIGTASPSRRLTVSGKAQFTSTTSSNEIYLSDTGSSSIDNQGIGSIGNDIRILAGGVERMRISSAGYVTMPNQPMFSTTRTAGSVTGAATAVVILWDNNLVNVGSHYNTATGRFTAPVAGTYYFSAMGMLDTGTIATADTQLIIMQNGGTISDSNPPMSGSATPQGMGFAASVLVTLAVGDYVDVRFYTNSGINKFYGAGGRFNNFSGFLVG